MRRSEAWPAILPYVLAAVLGLALAERGHAAGRDEFVIAAAQGYGLQDCLAQGGECGQAVADAWCEAQGRGAALSFGPADEPGHPAAEAGPFAVRCGD